MPRMIGRKCPDGPGGRDCSCCGQPPGRDRKAARAVLEAAELVKAPDWSESRTWLVVSGEHQLAVIEPAWRAGRRNGWRWRLTHSSTWNSRSEPTREKAAVAALGAWQRWTANKENR